MCLDYERKRKYEKEAKKEEGRSKTSVIDLVKRCKPVADYFLQIKRRRRREEDKEEMEEQESKYILETYWKQTDPEWYNESIAFS